MTRTSTRRLIDRREFLRCASSGAAAAALTRLHVALDALPQAGNEKFLTILNLAGGNDGLNTVVPFTLSAYNEKRPTLRIDQASGLMLPGNALYVLHPSLVNLAKLYAEGSVAIVLKVGYPRPSLSHFSSMKVWSRGYRQDLAPDSGWIARYKDLFAPNPEHVISLGTGRRLDFSGGTTSSLILNSVAGFGLHEDERYLANSKHRGEVIAEILANTDTSGLRQPVRKAIQLSYESIHRFESAVKSYKSLVVYPSTRLGRRLREMAMVVQAGLGTRIFYTLSGGFDTHGSQGARHAALLTGVDTALAAFAQDLKDSGAWNRAAVCVISEFGRRSAENGSGGTDHGSGSVVLVIGGAVRGGIYGPDPSEADLLQSHVPYEIDFRSIYRELLDKHLGADSSRVFTEKQVRTHRLGFLA